LSALRRTEGLAGALKRLPEHGCVAGPTVRVEGVAGNHADPRPPEAEVETLGVVARHRVQHKQGLARRKRFRLRVLHETLRDAALACGAVDEELGDLSTVRLIRGKREVHLNRADQQAIRKRSKEQPAALLDLGGHGLECVARFLMRERRHVADGRASGDAVGEHGCEPIELRVRLDRIETPDLYLLGHRMRIDTQVGVRHHRRVTPDRKRLIADALGRTPRTILEIDDGYDFEVAIVDDEWVFRFPRRSGVEEALELEIAVLPVLAPALPMDVPSFEYVSREPLFVGYRVIRGEPLVDEDAEGVRAFLGALHALDLSALPVEHPDWVESYRAQCAEFERLVLPLVEKDQRAPAKRLFGEAETLRDFEPALLHADLGPEHVLVRDRRLAGVIDWGDMRVGDPALDYAWLLNGPFPDWEVDPELRRRARFYHRLAPWYEAHYGLFTNRPANIERGLAWIRDRL
jgi:aminoglycoside phosphotransferase (APT) family kinase protein